MYRYLLLIFVSAFAIADCNEFYFNETKPTINQTGQEVCFKEYAVMYSQQMNAPLYAVQRLTSEQIKGSEAISRDDAFHAEKKVGARVRPSDYASTGYDKGHLVPAGDEGTIAAQYESFSMANMVPQVPVNNRIVWRGIEKRVHELAGKLDTRAEMYVVTGAVFGSDTISNKIRIPEYLFKAIYSPSTGHVGVYVAPNDTSKSVSVMSIRSFMEMSSVDPFPVLDEDLRSKIKLN